MLKCRRVVTVHASKYIGISSLRDFAETKVSSINCALWKMLVWWLKRRELKRSILCLYCINPAGLQKFIEVIIESKNIFQSHDSHLASKWKISSLCIFSYNFNCLVGFRNLSFWIQASPIPENCMPDSNMLNTWMLLANLCNGMLQSVRECCSLGFKLGPTMLELTMTAVVDSLPIVVDNEVCDVNFVFCQSFNCLENLVFGKSLTKSVPGTYTV